MFPSQPAGDRQGNALPAIADLRAGQPQMSWPASEDLIDHYLACVACELRGSGDNE
jgi:hypothetical protein